jgi:hypothetical protein
VQSERRAVIVAAILASITALAVTEPGVAAKRPTERPNASVGLPSGAVSAGWRLPQPTVRNPDQPPPRHAGSAVLAVPITVPATSAAGRSGPTPIPTPAPTPAPTAGVQTNCINVPSACGYPDATNTGVPAGTPLTARSGDYIITTPGTVINGWALTGYIEINANNVTVENSDITVNGTQAGCSSPCGGHGIWTAPGVTGTVIHDVTCHGGAPSGNNVTQYCIQSNNSSTSVNRVHAYNCTVCFAGPGSWQNSFIDQRGVTIPGEHYECEYYGGGFPSMNFNHNTCLQPQKQTATVFASVDFGNQNTLTITDNLLAGGGYALYGGGSGNGGSVLGPVTVSSNRFSRLYFPNGGYYGIAAYFAMAVTSWTGNVWDDTGQPVAR